MPNKYRARTPPSSASSPTPKAPPVIDPMLKRQAFPSVGMTLSSYKHDPFEALKASPELAKTQFAPKRRSRWQRLKQAITLKRAVLTILALVLLTGGWVGGKFLYNAQKIFGGNILSVLHTTKLKGEDRGRVNILLAGNSADDVGHNGGNLTDSIMLLSLDTKTHQAFMLSIPRDLWVDIPGDGHEKINAAYVTGEASDFNDSGYPEGGMGILEEIVEQDFGLPIDYYALVNYSAFRQAVNAVGGIDVTINSPDKRGLYDPNIDYKTHGPLVKLTNGVHHLTGQQALNLARARGDSYNSYGFPQSDFNRTEHQRQMLVALKSKAVSAGVLANPVKLSKLFDAIGGNVKTDLKLSEVHRLYDLTKDVSGSGIKSIGLNDVNGQNLLASYTAGNGQSALIPAAGLDDYSQIQQFLKKITSNDPVVKEAAKVVVLNATQAFGLAAAQAKALGAKNIIVTAVGDALADQTTTTIIDNSAGKKPHTKQLLQAYYKASVTTTNPYAAKYTADFIVVVGSNQVTN